MAPPPKDQAEIDARDSFASYQRGWRDGAAGRRPADVFVLHLKQWVRDAYRIGHGNGKIAYDEALRAAAAAYGIDLELAVLR